MTVTTEDFLAGFWALTSTWAPTNKRKLQNLPKIILCGNCHSTASIGAKMGPKVSFQHGSRIFFPENTLSDKCLILAVFEVEVQIPPINYFKHQHKLKGLGNIR